MLEKNIIGKYLTIFSLLLPYNAYAESSAIQNKKSADVLYNPPIVREATITWPEQDAADDSYSESYSDNLFQDNVNETVMNTRAQGSSHFIEAAITGPSDIRLEVELLVDTGASYVVLPTSLMEELDINFENTSPAIFQTVNGVTRGLLSELSTLEIGPLVISYVEVAFVPDHLLGNGIMLLGMSALKNYRVTLDNHNQTLTLIKSE